MVVSLLLCWSLLVLSEGASSSNQKSEFLGGSLAAVQRLSTASESGLGVYSAFGHVQCLPHLLATLANRQSKSAIKTTQDLWNISCVGDGGEATRLPGLRSVLAPFLRLLPSTLYAIPPPVPSFVFADVHERESLWSSAAVVTIAAGLEEEGDALVRSLVNLPLPFFTTTTRCFRPADHNLDDDQDRCFYHPTGNVGTSPYLLAFPQDKWPLLRLFPTPVAQPLTLTTVGTSGRRGSPASTITVSPSLTLTLTSDDGPFVPRSPLSLSLPVDRDFFRSAAYSSFLADVFPAPDEFVPLLDTAVPKSAASGRLWLAFPGVGEGDGVDNSSSPLVPVTPTHHDWSYNTHIVLAGCKEFILTPALAASRSHLPTLVPFQPGHPLSRFAHAEQPTSTLPAAIDGEALASYWRAHTSSVEPAAATTNVTVSPAGSIVVRLVAGQALVLPPLVRHSVRTVTPSLSISLWHKSPTLANLWSTFRRMPVSRSMQRLVEYGWGLALALSLVEEQQAQATEGVAVGRTPQQLLDELSVELSIPLPAAATTRTTAEAGAASDHTVDTLCPLSNKAIHPDNPTCSPLQLPEELSSLPPSVARSLSVPLLADFFTRWSSEGPWGLNGLTVAIHCVKIGVCATNQAASEHK